jgi:thioredoxin reductase (NADPH)
MICLLALLSSFATRSSEKLSMRPSLLSKERHTNLVQVAIIGGGVSGLAAAQTTAKKNLHTVIFEGEMPGGQMHDPHHLYNWIGLVEQNGRDMIQTVRKQSQKKGAIFCQQSVINVDFKSWPFVLTLSSGERVYALSVIIATGAQPKRLHIHGEDEYWNRGIVTTTFDKESKWKGVRAIVVGSGDDAVKKAQYFAKSAAEVCLIVRGKKLKTSDSGQLQNIPNVKVLYNTTLQAIFGDESSVREVEVISHGKVEKIACDVVAIGIGIEPNSRIFKRYISCNKEGYIRLKKRDQSTSRRGVFAVGDVTEDRYRKSLVAAADGIKAGCDVVHFLKDHELDTLPEQLHGNYFQKQEESL